MVTLMQGINYGTGTTTTGTSGIQSTGAVLRGATAGEGGFFAYFRFGIETWLAGSQVMVGLSAQNAALGGDPSAINNTLCFGCDTADTTWQFIRRGTAATKVDTAVSIAAGQVFDVTIRALPNASDVTVRVVQYGINSETVLIDNVTYSTNLPTNTTFMYAWAAMRATSGTTAKVLRLGRIYVETDY